MRVLAASGCWLIAPSWRRQIWHWLRSIRAVPRGKEPTGDAKHMTPVILFMGTPSRRFPTGGLFTPRKVRLPLFLLRTWEWSRVPFCRKAGLWLGEQQFHLGSGRSGVVEYTTGASAVIGNRLASTIRTAVAVFALSPRKLVSTIASRASTAGFSHPLDRLALGPVGVRFRVSPGSPNAGTAEPPKPDGRDDYYGSVWQVPARVGTG